MTPEGYRVLDYLVDCYGGARDNHWAEVGYITDIVKGLGADDPPTVSELRQWIHGQLT